MVNELTRRSHDEYYALDPRGKVAFMKNLDIQISEILTDQLSQAYA